MRLALVALLALTADYAPRRLNPLIDLLEQGQPVFGLYAPSTRRGGSSSAMVESSPAQRAGTAVAHTPTDFIFDGSMEEQFDAAFPTFAEFAKGVAAAGTLEPGQPPRLHHPLVVKTPEIAADPRLATDRIGRQLNLGVSTIVFVGVESADEVRTGLAAMRLAAHGGVRKDDVGDAPAFWGLSDREYRERADVWPLNPKGELLNWTIVESKTGLSHVREIAAVKGIGVLFPGAGTLRGVFTTTDATGQRVFDEQGWEAAIQQVLSACKEFHVACGFPARESDIEMRMKQGFSVFVIGWGEPGFRTVDMGLKLSNRSRER